jgi:hypothetical protein
MNNENNEGLTIEEEKIQESIMENYNNTTNEIQIRDIEEENNLMDFSIEQNESQEAEENRTNTTSDEEYVENDIGDTELVNEDKGDSIYTKYDNSLRIYFHNVNGLKSPGTSKWKACLEQFQELQCDIVGLIETNTNW